MKIFLTFLTLTFLLGWLDKALEEKAFEVYYPIATGDSLRIDVQLRYNEQGFPEEYFCHVKTPVCKEGLCHLLVVDLYWDLLGNFNKYELPPTAPLTKFDHEEFSEEDYAKLDRILANKRSLLGENRVEDLVDGSSERVSQEVDAVTGATVKAVENTVVSGAVYSTYALWHLVNGEIAERIPDHTDGLFDQALLEHFLASDNYRYHYYTLDALTEKQYATYMPQIMSIIKNGSLFVARYALNKIPDTIYADPEWQLALVEQFPEADFTTQQLLLKRFQSLEMGSESLRVLSQQLDQLSEQQLQEALLLMINNQSALDDNTMNRIVQLVHHENPIYAEQAYEALQQLSVNNDQVKSALKHYETTVKTNE
uniref:Uncharacterized protein n=1 Tax=Roseihalotalea indica TaxID=2867963 RepID=A0AA49JGW9_9BACT|nr:hypothetical protein K4G66_00770 [Tunicatimonas sp. TK19036]